MQTDLSRLRESIANLDPSRFNRWFAAIDRRCWHIARLPKEHKEQFYERARVALQTLQTALVDARSISLGAIELREPVQHFSFLAGWMAGEGLPISAAIGLCQGMQEAFGERPLNFYDDLALVVCEAYALGLGHAAQAHHRQIVQRSQVVCVLDSDVVALFLVADPDREALEDAIGRLMMLSVMRRAKAILVDASGLVDVEHCCEDVMRVVGGHRDALATRTVLLSGVSPGLGKHLVEIARFSISTFQRVDHALAALKLSV